MARRIKRLTIERLKEALHYDPETGAFTWKIHRGKATPGKVATALANDADAPYIYICLDYQRYYAHRLAWFYMTGEWPSRIVDHANGRHGDNRWINLRQATPAQSGWNRKVQSNNKIGMKGVSKRSSGKKRWFARINDKYIGAFATPEEAHAAYVMAAKEAHGEFFRAV